MKPTISELIGRYIDEMAVPNMKPLGQTHLCCLKAMQRRPIAQNVAELGSASDLSDRLGEGTFCRPSNLHAVRQHAKVDAGFSGPLTDAQAPAVEFEKRCATPIVLLHEGCGPSAIFRRIALRIVDAIKGHALRTFAKISAEIQESLPVRFEPPRANGDAFGSVMGIGRIGRTCAAVDHIPPRAIGQSSTGAMPDIRLAERGGRHFARHATAGQRVTVVQVGGDDFLLLAAITSATPIDFAPRAFRNFRNDEAPESSSRKIHKSHGVIIYSSDTQVEAITA